MSSRDGPSSPPELAPAGRASTAPQRVAEAILVRANERLGNTRREASRIGHCVEGILPHHDAGGACELAVQAVASHELLEDDVVVIMIGHRLRLHDLADLWIVETADGGHALETLLLEHLEELRADEDQPFDEGRASVGPLGRVEGAVEVVQNVDEGREESLVTLFESASEVAGGALAESLVLVLKLAVSLAQREDSCLQLLGCSRLEVEGGRRLHRAKDARRASVLVAALHSVSPRELT